MPDDQGGSAVANDACGDRGRPSPIAQTCDHGRHALAILVLADRTSRAGAGPRTISKPWSRAVDSGKYAQVRYGAGESSLVQDALDQHSHDDGSGVGGHSGAPCLTSKVPDLRFPIGSRCGAEAGNVLSLTCSHLRVQPAKKHLDGLGAAQTLPESDLDSVQVRLRGLRRVGRSDHPDDPDPERTRPRISGAGRPPHDELTARAVEISMEDSICAWSSVQALLTAVANISKAL